MGRRPRTRLPACLPATRGLQCGSPEEDRGVRVATSVPGPFTPRPDPATRGRRSDFNLQAGVSRDKISRFKGKVFP